MCLRLFKDVAGEVREEARRGLDPAMHRMQNDKGGLLPVDESVYPNFPEFVSFLVERIEKHAPVAGGPPPEASPLHPLITERLLPFLEEVFVRTAKHGGVTEAVYVEQVLASGEPGVADSVRHYQELIEKALEMQNPELQCSASKALLHLVRCRPAYFAPHYTGRLPWLLGFLLGGLATTRGEMVSIESIRIS
jgi:hypothetical protein